MSDKPRFSNAINNIDIMSYRAYKNLLNNGKMLSPNKSQKSKLLQASNYGKFNNERGTTTKDLTKSVFASQTKRFGWQTDEKINRGSELTGSIKDRRSQHLNSEKWQGFNNKNQDDKINNNNSGSNNNTRT